MGHDIYPKSKHKYDARQESIMTKKKGGKCILEKLKIAKMNYKQDRSQLNSENSKIDSKVYTLSISIK